MLDVGDLSNRSGEQNKDIFDIVLGVTQVINRNLLVQLNYSFSDASGYLNDPYKILSIVDPVSGDPVPRPATPGVAGPSHEYRFESRPDERSKHSLYAQAKYYLGGKVLDASYRYMTDDWDIDSHTIDARFRFPFGERSYLNHTSVITHRQKQTFIARALRAMKSCPRMLPPTTVSALSMQSR